MRRGDVIAIRWGILGTGRVASDLGRALVSGRDARPWAVASRTGARADRLARALGAPRSYSGAAELAADPQIDVVYVATPNHRHRDDALVCLEAGKAVLCEKPFAVDARQAAQVVATARAHGAFCMEAMWTRFVPAMAELDALLPEIGEPRMLTAQLGHPFRFDARSRLFDPGQGGGALLDLGVYPVSLAVRLFGTPVDVQASARLTESGVDEQCAVTLRFAGGRMAQVAASLCSEAANEAVILGTRGRIRVHAPLYRPERLTLDRFDPWEPVGEGAGAGPALSRSRILSAGAARAKRVARRFRPGGGRTVWAPVDGNGYGHQVEEVMRCLRDGRLESERMALDDTVAVMRVLDAARAAMGVRFPSDERREVAS